VVPPPIARRSTGSVPPSQAPPQGWWSACATFGACDTNDQV
jgi:hypothetical protein